MFPDAPALPPLLDLAGTAVFALTGALLAARLQQTFVTMAFFALVTGVGGGSLRDMLIGAPAFWLRDPWVALVIFVTALIAWFTPRRWWEGSLLEWADAAGMAAFAVLGAAKALAYGVDPFPAAVLGIVTGCAGGVVRDVIAGVPSIIMRPELYVTAAALSASLTVIGTVAGLPDAAAWTVAWAAGFALRGAAIRWQIALPSYRERERRKKEEAEAER
ncbi:trimeric intracellular cation channel family protein [Pelagerythrobacter rhizovicinus]|uniref:Trimeric intracellular cation channel family protein n=1 Tax=Pelagerythrobacter rhizovicinus TaxID=2268576 RepID=A0A4Q2KPG4_9SPHN|nr:trimeric intracellular cation channel family protein [Pelagerythrobacter rhizovicinus]RXZ66479.1 trimeric intracellular cation channel family protein [Pelagerythrobacter rhizovicinus]